MKIPEISDQESSNLRKKNGNRGKYTQSTNHFAAMKTEWLERKDVQRCKFKLIAMFLV